MSVHRPRNPLFALVALFGGLFAFTALCMFATTLGDGNAPPNRFFDRYGNVLIGVETVALVASSLLAMAIDSRQLAGQRRQDSAAPVPDPDSSEEDTP